MPFTVTESIGFIFWLWIFAASSHLKKIWNERKNETSQLFQSGSDVAETKEITMYIMFKVKYLVIIQNINQGIPVFNSTLVFCCHIWIILFV